MGSNASQDEKILEILHKRISDLEIKISRITNNSAPTVPKYDLTTS